MIKYFLCLCPCLFCLNCVNLHASALDDLVNQKKAEQIAEEQNRKQEQEKAKQKAQEPADIADCEQAVAKALDKVKMIKKEITPYAIFAREATVDSNGSVSFNSAPRVCGFAEDGIFICFYYPRSFTSSALGGYEGFIYTKNTDYAFGDLPRGITYIYKNVGNYKYQTTNGTISSVPAYRATSYKVSEIMPKTYLENKELVCCQYKSPDKIKGEIGIYVGKYTKDCHTKNYPNGYKGGHTLIHFQ